MAGVRNPDSVRLRGFPGGVNNVAPENDPPLDDVGRATTLRSAVNVDLVGPSKKPRRRAGYAKKIAGRAHSPVGFRQRLLAVVDGDLNAYDGNAVLASTVRPDVGDRHLSYAEVNGDLYWCSAMEFRRVRGADYADTPGWVDCPGTPAIASYDEGGLAAGTYRVAMTWFDAEGRESGAAGIAETDVAEGGGVRVFNIPAWPEGAVVGRLYMSPPDGDELYAAASVAPGASQVLLDASIQRDGKALDTLWRRPLPPCDILRFWAGRLIGFAGNLLVWSDPLRFGLTANDNYMRFGLRGTLLEAVGDGAPGSGLWLADHKNTYWLDGSNPKEWSRTIKYDHPAVFGTSLVVKGTDVGLDTAAPVAVWMAANGVLVAGLPGGDLQPLTEGRLAMPTGDVGAAMYRELDGLRQLVMSYIGTGANHLAIGDRASASVIRATTPN
jgi:hypothetical protein